MVERWERRGRCDGLGFGDAGCRSGGSEKVLRLRRVVGVGIALEKCTARDETAGNDRRFDILGTVKGRIGTDERRGSCTGKPVAGRWTEGSSGGIGRGVGGFVLSEEANEKQRRALDRSSAKRPVG
jgi:hypothetical protein